MTTQELIDILKTMDPKGNVSLVFNNGEGVEVASVEEVRDNAGPSLYAMYWNGKKDEEKDEK